MRKRVGPLEMLAYAADMPSVAQKIRALRLARQMNQTEFGELLGVTQASVSRWEKGSMPDPPLVARLAQMAGEEVRQFLGGDSDISFIPAANRFMVRGTVAAGVWVEAFEWPQEEWEPYTGGDHIKADAGRRFGLRVEGDSMNMIYPQGTILDCISTLDGVTPKTGQRVIVVRKRVDESLEATVKEYLVDESGKEWLVPRSTNPAFQTPFSVDQPGEGVVGVEIIGVVVGSYRPE
jgi:transcriptional regulator with XRE-family HTH domain